MRILPDATVTRLLGSMDANHLVALCGAGLSVPQPSGLMSAVHVAEACYDKWSAIGDLQPEIRQNIGKIADHFYRLSPQEFESVFLSLVPWNELVGQHNAGHAALGDFLVSRAMCGVLSTNFDGLIEQWGEFNKVDLRGALTGQEASDWAFCANQSPLVKFHGCMTRDRKKTLWTDGQLADGTIKARVTSCSQWMQLNLPGKDLVVIGFWSDWAYLNQVLAKAMDIQGFDSVTVIDPLETAKLEQKAPQLWATLLRGSDRFEHIPGSGADALDELRTAFSRVWIERFYALAKEPLKAAGRNYTPLDLALDGENLYRCRQDAEGLPYNRAARNKTPSAHSSQAAYMHHIMTPAASAREGSWYVVADQRVRIVQGAGKDINSVRQQFNEPPAIKQPDVVVCAGAEDYGVPGRIVPSGQGENIVRAVRGGSADWITSVEAIQRFGLGAPVIVQEGGGSG